MNSLAQGSNKPGTDSDRKSNICSEDFTVISHVCQVIMARKETGCGTTEIARQRGTIKKAVSHLQRAV